MVLMGQGLLSDLDTLEGSRYLAVFFVQQFDSLQAQHEQLKAKLQAEQATSEQALALLQQIHQLSAAGSSAVTPSAAVLLPAAPQLVLVKPEGGSKRKAAGSTLLHHKQKRTRKGKEQPSAPDLPVSEQVEVQRISGRTMSEDTQLQVYRIKYKGQDCFLEADAIRLHGGDCNDYSLIRRVGVGRACYTQLIIPHQPYHLVASATASLAL